MLSRRSKKDKQRNTQSMIIFMILAIVIIAILRYKFG